MCPRRVSEKVIDCFERPGAAPRSLPQDALDDCFPLLFSRLAVGSNGRLNPQNSEPG